MILADATESVCKSMRIEYSKKAVKVINGLDRPTKARMRNAIERLPEGDVKPLEGREDGIMRLRVGKYRVIYEWIDIKVTQNKEDTLLDENTDETERVLHILDVGSRGDIYK